MKNLERHLKQLLKDFDKYKMYIKKATLSIDSNIVKYKETYKQPNL